LSVTSKELLQYHLQVHANEKKNCTGTVTALIANKILNIKHNAHLMRKQKQSNKTKTKINKFHTCSRVHKPYLQMLDLYMSYKHPLQGAEVWGAEARNHDWLDQLKTDKIHN